MDLLMDIAVYGIGAVVLIVVVLALVGFVTGLTAWAQAWKEVRQIGQSGILAEIEARRLALEASRRTSAANARDATTWDLAAERVIYPSRRFDRDTERLIGRGAAFVVTVAMSSRKRRAVERELPEMIHFHRRGGSLLRGIVDKFQTMGLWACVANAILNRQYLVAYDVAADITIRFEPKPPANRLKATAG
jgi:hypothetical protein